MSTTMRMTMVVCAALLAACIAPTSTTRVVLDTADAATGAAAAAVPTSTPPALAAAMAARMPAGMALPSFFRAVAMPRELVGQWVSDYRIKVGRQCWNRCEYMINLPDGSYESVTYNTTCSALLQQPYGITARTLLVNATTLGYFYNATCTGLGEGFLKFQAWADFPVYLCLYFRRNFDTGKVYLSSGQVQFNVSTVDASCPDAVRSVDELLSPKIAAGSGILQPVAPTLFDAATAFCKGELNTAPIAAVAQAFENFVAGSAANCSAT